MFSYVFKIKWYDFRDYNFLNKSSQRYTSNLEKVGQGKTKKLIFSEQSFEIIRTKVVGHLCNYYTLKFDDN